LKYAARFIGVVGLATVALLIFHEGPAAMLALLARAGLRLLWLVPLHALPLALDANGWRTLLEGARRRAGDSAAAESVPLSTLFGIATVRESINRLLPVANVGGELVGIRLLAQRGVPTTTAAASVIVEGLLTLVSLYVFIALGLLALLHAAPQFHGVGSILLGLDIGLPIILAVALLLRYGSVFARAGRLLERLFGREAPWFNLLQHSSRLDAEIRRFYRPRSRLLRTVGWQVAGLLAGTLETWLALRWLAHPVTPAAALALEALTQAIRNFAFLVPSGLGLQEVGLLALGAVLGVNGPTALALSLAKRMRDILFGVPSLLTWQWLEMRGQGAAVRANGHRAGTEG
jgi:putative membrane protein